MFFVRGFFPTRRYFSIAPENDLGGNSQNIDPVKEIAGSENSYLLLIDYSNVSEDNSPRAELVKGERKKIFDFYEKNKGAFELVDSNPIVAYWLYRYNGVALSR